MKGTINKGIANPHTQPQRIANPLERGTDKLAIPVWSLAALIAAIDVFYADKEEFVGE